MPPATVSIATPQTRTRQEQRYLDTVLPLTERLVGEGRRLAELGTTRSRNVFELTTRADRFESAAEAIRAAESAGGVPPQLAPFSSSLNAGIDAAEASIADAKAAFVRFDWDGVQVAVTTFSGAVDAIASAATLVEQA